MNPEQLRLVLVEGKKRQIRRMCKQVGTAHGGAVAVFGGEVGI